MSPSVCLSVVQMPRCGRGMRNASADKAGKDGSSGGCSHVGARFLCRMDECARFVRGRLRRKRRRRRKKERELSARARARS